MTNVNPILSCTDILFRTVNKMGVGYSKIANIREKVWRNGKKIVSFTVNSLCYVIRYICSAITPFPIYKLMPKAII